MPNTSAIIAMLVVSGVLFALLHRLWTTLALTAYLMCFVVLASVIKQSYLGMAASLADVVFFLQQPLGNFRLFIGYPLLGMALLLAITGFVLCLVAGLKWERPLQHAMAKPRRWIWRGVSATASVLLSVVGVMLTHSLHARMTDDDVFAAFQSMNQMQTVSGAVNRLNYFFDNRSTAATLPGSRVQSRFVATSADGAVQTERPDILMILEESTFDSRLIGNCASVDCDYAMLHPLTQARRIQQGPLQVHSTGGGT